MSSATGIRLHYCEMEKPWNLPSYALEQHYGRCRHTRQLPGERDNARNNARWTKARKTRTAWMDNIRTWTGLPVEESIRMTEHRDKWRKYVHGVANPRIEDG